MVSLIIASSASGSSASASYSSIQSLRFSCRSSWFDKTSGTSGTLRSNLDFDQPAFSATISIPSIIGSVSFLMASPFPLSPSIFPYILLTSASWSASFSASFLVLASAFKSASSLFLAARFFSASAISYSFYVPLALPVAPAFAPASFSLLHNVFLPSAQGISFSHVLVSSFLSPFDAFFERRAILLKTFLLFLYLDLASLLRYF